WRKTHLSDTRGHFQAMLLLSGRRIQYENASVALLGQRRHNRHALAVRREGDGTTAVNSPPIPPRPVSGVPQIDGVINVVTSAATGENRPPVGRKTESLNASAMSQSHRPQPRRRPFGQRIAFVLLFRRRSERPDRIRRQ